MRLLEEWEYKFVEDSLKNYMQLRESNTETDIKVCQAIERALQFFKDTEHELIMHEFYFNHKQYQKRYTTFGHHIKVFEDIVGRTSANGYFVRREIMYKVAMYLYANGIFKFTEEGNCDNV